MATLHVIAWIVFLGLCVKTGAILYSFFVSLAINHEGAKNICKALDCQPGDILEFVEKQ
ncbi:MAG TPA: helix-turn-helix domain-containing protein [Chitinophagaceae bacterium]|nr:helix-turn-helix domain-containing protein [Chitinophagaceae bacterium]